MMIRDSGEPKLRQFADGSALFMGAVYEKVICVMLPKRGFGDAGTTVPVSAVRNSNITVLYFMHESEQLYSMHVCM